MSSLAMLETREEIDQKQRHLDEDILFTCGMKTGIVFTSSHFNFHDAEI